jgi:hydroxysqualene dehydroxylase
VDKVTSQKREVAIVGAGVSGLAAAVHLATSAERERVHITLFEARREAGGRTRSWLDEASGDILDNGQHLLMGCYTSTLSYLKKIGSIDQLEWSKGLQVPFAIDGKVGELNTVTRLPSPFNLLGGILFSGLYTAQEKIAASRFGNALRKGALQDIAQGKTCEELLSEARQPSSLTRKLWEPIILATMNTSVARASAEVFLNVLKLAFFSDTRSASILYPKLGLTDLLIDPALELLFKKGHEIRLGAPVDGMTFEPNAIALLASGSRQDFDSVILTLGTGPGLELPKHIDQSIPPIEYSPITNAYLWLDRKVIASPIHAFIGTNIQWAFAKPTDYGAQRLALTVSVSNKLDRFTNDELSDIFFRELKQCLPLAREAKVLRSQIIREKRATALLTPDLQRARPRTRSMTTGLYFAGDLVQNGLPMTIEGAIRNGQQAAAELLADLGRADKL